MPTTYFKDLFDEAERGSVGDVIPEGVYDVEVVEARGYEGNKPMLFLELRVLNGPVVNKVASVNITFPTDDAKRGMRIYFAKKIAGLIAYPDVKTAFQTPTNSVAEGLDVIGAAVLGKQVKASIGIQKEGQYAGSNELRETKAITGAPAPVASAPAATPQQEAAPAPAPTEEPADAATSFADTMDVGF